MSADFADHSSSGPRAASRALFDELAGLPADSPRREEIRAALVALHTGLAVSLARRVSRYGEPDDDLQQVALLGLLKAIDRFDPAREVEFSSFATPTIRGEIRRYFRDTAWATHVPRGLRELAVQIPKTVEWLTADLGRSPRPSEVADALGVPPERVVEALEAAEGFSAIPLDAPSNEGRPLNETIGSPDESIDLIDERAALRPLIAALPEREQRILLMRFFEERSQSDIAKAVGVSQMHVSRILSRLLADLRTQLDEASVSG